MISSAKKILIITRQQFGYHTDTYYYSKYAESYFAITHIGFDAGRPKIKINGVDCIYVSRNGNVVFRYIRFLIALLRECRKDYDVIFIKYFIGSSLLKLFNQRKIFVFDIRTGSVAKNIFIRKFSDFICRLESRFFRYITVISSSLAIKLRLPENRVHVLPLGAEPVNESQKQYDSLRLLYVGTFNGRKIGGTIEGFARFYAEFSNSVDIAYYIVGDGHGNELEKLRELVKQKELEHVIFLPGYIHQSELEKYYHQSNRNVPNNMPD